MASLAPWLAALILLPLLTSAPSVAPGAWDEPDESRPHLTPPNPSVRTWPEGLTHGTVTPRYVAETTGIRRLPVLLIEFTDVAHDPLHEGVYFDDAFNNASTGARSVRAYYNEVSFGQLTVDATITPTWWQSSRTMAFYGNDTAGGVDNRNGPIYSLVVEAVRAADPSVNFASFDGNADGVVDHLVVVHAGLGQEDHNDTDLIWSHRWAVSDADPVAPGSQSLEADGVQIYGYIMVSEASPIGVVTHEFGHDLGLPDLYDADESSAGVGRWDLMAGGAWNGFPAGSSPAHLSAWSRARLGWITPVTVTGILEGTRIEAIETRGFAYLLPIRSGFQPEYFLVENRQATGFDAALPGSGLLIWHVDESVATNDGDGHRLLDLEEADEAFTGDRPVDPEDSWRSTAVGFGPETVPNSRAYNGEATNWRVRDISAADAVMIATIARDVHRDLAIPEIKRDLHVTSGTFTRAFADVVVRNEGQDTEVVDLHVQVYFERIRPESLVAEQDYTTDIISPQTSLDFRVDFDTTLAGRYVIHANVTLDGDEIPSNNERLAHVLSNAFAYIDSVESGPDGWSLDGTASDPHRWRVVDNLTEGGSFYSPTHAWRFGYVPTSSPNPSPPRWHTLTSRPIVFVQANETCPTPEGCEVHLFFYQRYDLWGRIEPFPPANASETDHAFVEVRFQRATWTSWTPVAHFVGRDLAWRGVSANLTEAALGSDTLQVRFNVSADVMPGDGGWWVDDFFVASHGLGHAVAILAPTPPIQAHLGGSASVDIKVVNVGETDADVALDAMMPLGWEVRLSTDGRNTTSLGGFLFRLAPDQSLALRIIVAVPGDAVVGSIVAGTLSAIPRQDAAAQTSIPIEILVSPPEGTLPGLTVVVVAVVAAAALLGALAVVLRRRRSRLR